MDFPEFKKLKDNAFRRIKQNFEKLTNPEIEHDDCSSRIFHQISVYENMQSVFFFLFLVVAVITVFTSDIIFQSIPIAGLFIFEMSIFFLLFTKKLFVKIEKDDDKWFKTRDFQNVAIHYFLTRKHFRGQIVFFIFLLSMAFLTQYSIDIVDSFDKKTNENIIDVLMESYKEALLSEPEFKNKITSLMFIMPWFPLVLLFSHLIFKLKLWYEKDFEFYFAYATLKTLNECEEAKDTARFNLFKIGLDLYDSFLRSRIKLSIANIDKIYSKTIGNTKNTQNEIYKKILETFDDKDTYKPLKYLGEIVGDETVLVKRKKISEKFKAGLPIALSIILAIISIVRILVIG